MVRVSLTSPFRRLCGSAAIPPGMGDGELLHRFAIGRDPAAFAALVERHSRLVWSVCRNVLGHDHDAEDAFQAVFLILSRDAAAIRKAEALASWLHGVAYRVAMRAKRDAARRRLHERRAALPAGDHTVSEAAWRELQAALDEEVQGLPPRLRVPFVLCVLESRSQAEAAEQLGWKASTVAARLSQARQELLRRLERRGVSLSAVLCAAALSRESASAAVPAALMHATLRVAQLQASAAGAGEAMTARVATLVKGVKPTMLLTKTKIASALLLLLALLATGTEWVSRYLAAAPPEVAPLPPAAAKDAPGDTFEVRGRVLDPAGKAVAGARLYWPRRLKETVGLKQRGTTDKDGRFKLRLPRKDVPPGQPTVLVAAADGFGFDWVELPRKGAPGDVTLRLVKDVPIRGRILSTEGKPISGVTITIAGVMVLAKLDDFLAALPRGYRAIETMPLKQLKLPLNAALRVRASGKDGRFEIAGAGGERVLGVEVSHPGIVGSTFLVATRQGSNVTAVPVGPTVPGSRGGGMPLRGPSFDYIAEPERLIEGTVRETGSGKPVVGAIVVAYNIAHGGRAFSDAHGRYRLHGLSKAQRYFLSVMPPKNSPLISYWVNVPDRGGRLEPLKVDLEMPRGVLVTGRVLDKVTGKGVASGIQFMPFPDNPFYKMKGLLMYADTDAEGRFRLGTVPGSGVLLASVNGKRPTKNGVRLYPYPINVYKPVEEFDAKNRKRVQATGLNPSLRLFHAYKVVDFKASATATCNLTVDPGITRTLYLEGSEGKPLAGVIAAGISPRSFSAFKQETADCPVYALDANKPRRLILLHRERKLAAVLTLRGDKGPKTIRLQPTGVIIGRLLDTEGKPLAGVYVVAGYPGGALFALGPERALSKELYRENDPPRTDANGRFRLEGIVPGLKIGIRIRLAQGRRPLRRLRLEAPPKLKPLEAGKTLDLGDLKAGPEAR